MGVKKGTLSSRNKQYWINKGYDEENAVIMARSRMPGTVEYYMIYNGLSKEIAIQKRDEFQNKRALTLTNMIKKYGKVEGEKRWASYIKKQAYSNSYEYKRDKYGWTREQFDNYNLSRGQSGENNGNYNSSYYQVWVKKFGKDVADEMNKEVGKLKAKGGYNQKGKTVSDKSKEKMRKSAIKRIELQGGIISYNPDSIPIIEQYGKEHGYNFQHAENGGEFQIIGYSVDGYDAEKNVVIEYYEKFHDRNVDKDNIRQNNIINELKCKFIIIKYDGTIEEFEYEEN